MKIGILFFLICNGWHPVQSNSTSNGAMTSNFFYHHKTCSAINQNQDGKTRIEETPSRTGHNPLNQSDDNVTVMDELRDFQGSEHGEKDASEEPTEHFPFLDIQMFFEELAINVSILFKEKKHEKIVADCSHHIFNLYNKTLNISGKFINEYANLASGYCMDILVQSENYFNETSRVATKLYEETVANCERLYKDCYTMVTEFYEQPRYNFRKLIIDYSDMTISLYNETLFKLGEGFKVCSDDVLAFYSEAKIKLRNQYDKVVQQISLTYCFDCVIESPLFYNLSAALVLIHVHRNGLNVITLLYLFLKFFVKSKLLVSAYHQFVQPLHSAFVANSKIILSGYQMPKEEVYFYFLILHFVASSLFTSLWLQKTRVLFTTLMVLSTVGIYVKTVYLDREYSFVSSFNSDDMKYTNECLNINHLESDILLIFMAIASFLDKSEKIATAFRSNTKLGCLIQIVRGHCTRLIFYFIMLTSIIPATFFLVSKLLDLSLEFWPYQPTVVCEINATNEF
jgi:hypothetical protein